MGAVAMQADPRVHAMVCAPSSCATEGSHMRDVIARRYGPLVDVELVDSAEGARTLRMWMSGTQPTLLVWRGNELLGTMVGHFSDRDIRSFVGDAYWR